MDEITNLTVNSVSVSTSDDPITDMDTLLDLVGTADEHLSVNEFVKIDEEIPLFNE